MLSGLTRNISVKEGDDMTEWRKRCLGEITSFMSKGIPPKYVERENENTVRVLNQKCNRNFEINYEESRLHDCSKKKAPADKMLQPGDVLINSTGTGTAGRVAQLYDVPTPTTIDGHMILLRPTEEIDSIYYGYAVKAFQPKIETLAEGSTGQTEINRKRLQEEIVISFPEEKETQERIARFLLNIDEKIKVNGKINKNLEQQAKALYKDWFFDFSPFSSDGNLPNGWHIGTVGDIIQLHDSKRVPLSGAERDKMAKVYPYYGATSLMDYVDNYLFDGIYLLLGEDGTVVDSLGFPILQYVYGQFWVNNHAHIITGKEGFSVEELYLFFSLTNIKSIVTGAVQQKISQQNLKKVPAIIPSKQALSAFDEIIQPIFAQIRNLRDENANLSRLRDTLLPKLMSGELDVSDIDL